jgi:hypothetical protein
MGQNSYGYLTQNAADLEEFDEKSYVDGFWNEGAERTAEDKILQGLMTYASHNQ